MKTNRINMSDLQKPALYMTHTDSYITDFTLASDLIVTPVLVVKAFDSDRVLFYTSNEMSDIYYKSLRECPLLFTIVFITHPKRAKGVRIKDFNLSLHVLAAKECLQAKYTRLPANTHPSRHALVLDSYIA